MADRDTVDTPSAAWIAMESRRHLARTLMGGTRAMRAAGETYLPKWPREEQPEYDRRLAISTLDGAYEEAISSIVNQVFSHPLDVEAPDPVLEIWRDVDGRGTKGESFSLDVARESLAEGISAVLVDMPQADVQLRTRQQERSAGIRPRWIHLRNGELIEALPVPMLGSERMLRARRRIQRVVPVGEWSSEQRTVIKVYRRGVEGMTSTAQEYVLVKVGGQDEWVPDPLVQTVPPLSASAEIRDRFTEIPIVPWYTIRSGFFVGYPALENLAELNAAHWRKSSDKDNSLSVASIPAKAFIGFTEEQVKALQWGAYRAVYHPDSNAHVDDIAHEAKSVEMAQEDLERLERRMAIAALEPGISRATGEEKATVRLLDEARRITRAQAWAISWLGTIEDCLRWTAAWLGESTEGIRAEYKEEVFLSLAQPKFDQLIEMRQLDPPAISLRTLQREAQRFGHLSDGLDLDEEAALLASERAPATNGDGTDAT